MLVAVGRPRFQILCVVRARSVSTVRDPHHVLGLQLGATSSEIKRAYYELALRTHPDARVGKDQGTACFVEVQEAFATLMDAAASRSNAAASGSRTGVRAAAGRPAAAARPGATPPTLGEILCARLTDEPSAAPLVWADIKAGQYDVTPKMMDSLFKAVATHSPGSPGMREALAMLRDATSLGVLSASVRASAIVSLLTWCKEEELDVTFEMVDEVQDSDRTPEVLAALNSTFCPENFH